MEKIKTLKGLVIDARFVEEYPHGKLFFAQERLVVTDLENNELANIDVIELIMKIKQPIQVFELKEDEINYTFEDPDDLDEESVDPEP